MRYYDKIYASPHEEQRRFAIFRENLRTIQEHNELYEQGIVSYRLGINKFADQTRDEFASRLTYRVIYSSDINKTEFSNSVEVPDSVDWRTEGAVTYVKDQGGCTASWAFSAAGALEGQYSLMNGRSISLSAQQLIDCDTENDGCSGGNPMPSYNYVKDEGLESWDDYPYTGNNGVCRHDETISLAACRRYEELVASEDNLKVAVGAIGPISIAVDATDFFLYSSGIFYDAACSSDILSLNHAVLAVGYDTISGQDYWIIKNSWGPEWGEDGYIRLARNIDNHCGVASAANFPVKYNKTYKSILQDTTRFKNFRQNLRRIEEHNEKYERGEISYKLGVTKFADKTQKEFKNQLNSLQDSTDDEFFVAFPPSASEDVPDEKDWRKEGVVSGVKDQGSCIASWAFAATASLESCNAIIKEQLLTFSEQYLIDCNKKNNYGCGGGRVINAGKDGLCKMNGTLLKDVGFAAVRSSEEELKYAVGLTGPIVSSLDVSGLSLYAGGVYDEPDCKNDSTNHQIVIVGYGSTNNGTDYWLIKNSWGTDWGEDGYLRLLRRDNYCGILNSAMHPIIYINDATDFSEVNEKDEL
ncbi:hypothetical protein NQ318_004763 [Aromia moschata]|uniref:Cathepsin L n=1 Tax=Aromia moschata TaxID=1265417 RepID=A0AAV8XX95_9CUCU|nr:hypothetical protein NQ318_004763 [Aromia moschata]